MPSADLPSRSATPPLAGTSHGLGSFGAEAVGREVDASIRWCWDHATSQASPLGYGQVVDRDDVPEISSVAATGFALAAWCLGVERGVLDPGEVTRRVRGTLRTLARVPSRDGFMVHFTLSATAQRRSRSEYSTIDTGLALDGAVVAAAYLDDPVVSELTDALLARVDWAGAVHEREGRTLLHMARVDDAGDSYGADSDREGWVGAWDMTAEQLTLYVLAAGSPQVDPGTARKLWAGFERPLGEFGGHTCVYEPGGTLFTYHFPIAFWPFGTDPQGTCWWSNAREATLANRAWCLDRGGQFPSFDAGWWGTSASLGPWGYTVNGARPSRHEPHCEGTVPPVSLVGAALVAPEVGLPALERLAREHPGAWHDRYGWCDAFNLGAGAVPSVDLEGTVPSTWYASARYGLNKGASALLGAAALGEHCVWEAYGRHPWVRRGLQVLGLEPALTLPTRPRSIARSETFEENPA